MLKKRVGKQIVKNDYLLKANLLRRGMRTRHSHINSLNRHFWRSVKSAAVIIVSLLLGLFAWNTSVLSETVVAEAETRDKIEQVVMSCLQHGAAFINSELHLCRPANTWVKK